MRWDDLFADLEGQLQGVEAAESRSALVQAEQQRRQSLTMTDRLLAMEARAASVTLGLRRGRMLRVVLTAHGAGWVAGRVGEDPASSASYCLIPVIAITWINVSGDHEYASLKHSGRTRSGQHESLTAPNPDAAGPVRMGATSPRSAVTLAQALRDLGRRGVVVDVLCGDGSPRGRIRRVGADHVDVSLADQVVRRPSPIRIVPFAEVDAVVWSSVR